MQNWETVIGLEIHVQLSTASKAFCADSAAFGGEPNARVSAISLAHPGVLPVLNEKHVESALKLGLALGCAIQPVSFFERKNYFYADLPKGFQTTQNRWPICTGGQLQIGEKTFRIHHFHMEEDAGKSIHDQSPDESLIDLNRAGVPLLEIVTEPDFRAAEDVAAFIAEIRRLVRWIGISDGNMEQGSLRCDINLSLRRPGAERLGTRCEIKNVNSMRFARRAIEHEARRQAEILEAGGQIEQQTRSFDPSSGATTALRDKEDADDYRYFLEPDLPPVVVGEALLAAVKAQQPVMPWVLERRFVEALGLSKADAALLTAEKKTADFFEKTIAAGAPPRAAANLIVQRILPLIGSQLIDFEALAIPTAHLVELLALIETGKISASTAFQKLWPALMERPFERPESLAAELHLFQAGDADFLEKLAAETLEKWPEKAAEFRKGKKGLLGFFTGEAMKASRGKADPQALARLFEEKLKGS